MLPISHPVSSDEPPLLVVHEFDGADAERDRELEALWFSLCTPEFQPVVFVPVPDVTGVEVLQLCSRLATSGAVIQGGGVVVVDALGVGPAEIAPASLLLHRLADIHQHMLIVVESPVAEPASLPIVSAFGRVALVVGLDRSRLSEVAAMCRLAPDEIFGVVCVDPKPHQPPV